MLDFAMGLFDFGIGLGGSVLAYAIPFLFVLTLVVFIHEFGHFQVARWCGVKVEAFSIGFGRAIASWRDREGTQWKIGWLPLGGYVKFHGDESAASTPDRHALDALSDPRLRDEAASCFHFKPLWQRAAIVAAGPFANFLLAILIFGAGFMLIGEERLPARLTVVPAGSPAAEAGLAGGDLVLSIDGRRIEGMAEFDEIVSASAGRTLSIEVERQGRVLVLGAAPIYQEMEDRFGNRFKIGTLGVERLVPPIVGEVSGGLPAAEAGLRRGDVIRTIDGRTIETFRDIQAVVEVSAGKALSLGIEREGVPLTLPIVPAAREETDAAGAARTVGRIGISPLPPQDEVVFVRHDPLTAVWKGVERTVFIIDRTLSFVAGLFVGREDATQLSGPIGIAKVSGDVAQLGFLALINLAAVLSISIGLINLFPIPMLDGGHLMYYAYEAVRGRPMGERAQELGFRLGLAFVISLMVFATWNDLVKLRIFG